MLSYILSVSYIGITLVDMINYDTARCPLTVLVFDKNTNVSLYQKECSYSGLLAGGVNPPILTLTVRGATLVFRV